MTDSSFTHPITKNLITIMQESNIEMFDALNAIKQIRVIELKDEKGYVAVFVLYREEGKEKQYVMKNYRQQVKIYKKVATLTDVVREKTTNFNEQYLLIADQKHTLEEIEELFNHQK